MYAVGCNDTKERNNKMKPTVFKGSAVALVTPMKEDGSVNYDELARLLCFQLQNQMDAIVATGTTGESATLTGEAQAERLLVCLQKYGFAERRSQRGTVTVKRTEHTLL